MTRFRAKDSAAQVDNQRICFSNWEWHPENATPFFLLIMERIKLREELPVDYAKPNILCAKCGRVVKNGESFSLVASVYHTVVFTIAGKHFPSCENPSQNSRIVRA
jgi:hypothetical protein